MTEYTIQAQSARLYIRLTESNIHVTRYRTREVDPGMEELIPVGTWQLHPTLSSNPKISHFELVRMITAMTGDNFNAVISKVVHHKTSREQGNSPLQTSTTPTSDSLLSSTLKQMSPSPSPPSEKTANTSKKSSRPSDSE